MNTRTILKFDNKAIDKIKVEDLEFSFITKDGQVKYKDRLSIPFDVPKKSILKGLKLLVLRNTGSKFFVLQFWFNSKADYFHCGKFSEEFGTKEVEDKLLPIVRSHTNDRGHFFKLLEKAD